MVYSLQSGTSINECSHQVWFAKVETFYRTTQYKLTLIALLTLAPHHPLLLESYFNKIFNVILVSLEPKGERVWAAIIITSF